MVANSFTHEAQYYFVPLTLNLKPIIFRNAKQLQHLQQRQNRQRRHQLWTSEMLSPPGKPAFESV